LLPKIGSALIVLIIAYFVSKYVDKVMRKLMGDNTQPSVKRLARKAIAIVVFLGGIFIAWSVLPLYDAVKSMIAGGTISGLVIGLALQVSYPVLLVG
jgi:small conductance mechanosensitive channel